jgi:hypothetical protein
MMPQYRVSVLVAIKFLHTLIWAIFAGCILGLPLATVTGQFDWAGVLSALVLIECLVLALNRGSCPLTSLAARFTSERSDNFDIYLPNWLARHNKKIFGTLFIVFELFAIFRWAVQPRV